MKYQYHYERVMNVKMQKQKRLNIAVLTFFAAVLLLSIPGPLNARGQKEPDAENRQEQEDQAQNSGEENSAEGNSAAGTDSDSSSNSDGSGSFSMLPLRADHKFAVLQGWNVRSGKEVNSGVLGRKEATIINIWATTCPACMQELPKLAELTTMLPENAGILGISLDAAQRPEDVLDILERFDITYTTIAPHPSIEELLYETAPYIPATVIVDGSGKILSGPHYGVKEKEFFLDELDKLGIR